MSIRIAIAGIAGRMGQALVNSAGADFVIAGGSERAGSDALGVASGGWRVSDSAVTAAQSADAWIDFTTPAASLESLEQLKQTIACAGLSVLAVLLCFRNFQLHAQHNCRK